MKGKNKKLKKGSWKLEPGRGLYAKKERKGQKVCRGGGVAEILTPPPLFHLKFPSLPPISTMISPSFLPYE